MQKHFFKLLIVFQLVTVSKIFSQNFAINSTGSLPDTSAILDVSSTTKGFLMPRLSTAQMNAIALPATGLIVFNTTINMFEVNVGTPSSPLWQALGTANNNWLTSGNSGTNSGSQFIGTTDSVSLRFRTNNNVRMVLDSLGNVGIGTSTPGSSLDVKGTLHLSGSTSGYVGFAPAATAGSTTYTLPVADGATGQMLSTNGSGSLSWATPTVTTTNTLSSSGNVVTSTVNGIAATANTVNAVANNSSTNTLTTTVNGVTGTGVNIINTNGLNSSTNTLTSTINGVASPGVNIINTNTLNSTTNTLTSTINGVASSGVNIINSNALSLSGGNLTSTINGVASSALGLSSLDSSIYKMDGSLWATRTVTMGANNLTFGSTTGNLIFNPSSTGKFGIGNTTPTKTLDVTGTGRFTSTLTVGAYTLPATDGTANQVLATNGSGTLSWAVPTVTTTNTLSSSSNVLTSTVNGIAATANAVNTVANNSSANTLTTTINGITGTGVNIINTNGLNSSTNTLTSTINGVASSGVNIINSNALSLSGGNLTSTVNGVASSALGLSSLDSSIYKMDGTLWATRTVTMGANNLTFGSTSGNLIFNPSSTGKFGIGTTTPASTLDVKGTLHLSGSTSGYVGFTPASAAGSTTYTLPSTDGTNGQALITNGSATLSWGTPTTTHTLSSSGNVITSIVNGVSATANAVNTVANNSSTNTLTTTINGVTGTGVNIINTNGLNSSTNTLTSTINGVASSGVNIINSNALSLSGGNLTSTINGVASSALGLSSLDSSIYKMDGTLWATRTVTMGANNLTFGSTSGNLIFNPSSTGKFGIGTTTPASTLDVKGTLHLSGSTSGYVGFTPASAAGSTTYTLPSADGTNGQALITNGSATLSWGTPTTTHTLSSSANVITSIVNGVSATANAVNTVANNSSTNTLTTSINGVTGTGVNIINTNALNISSGNLTSTINGVASSAIALPVSSANNGLSVSSNTVQLGGNLIQASTITNNGYALNVTGSAITSTFASTGYLGIGTTSPTKALHVVFNSSGTNVATFQNTNAAGFSSMDWLDNNGNLSSTFGFANASTGGIFSNRAYMNSYAHDFVLTSNSSQYNILISGSTGNVGINNSNPGSSLDVTGTLRLSGSTSGYVGFAPASAAGSTTYTLPTADGTNGQQLTTNGSGVLSWTNPATISSVSNTSSANSLTTTVSGVTGTAVNIINTNALSLSGQSITSTVNGVASSSLNISGVDSSIYKTDGTLWANRTVTMGANNLTFNSTTGNFIVNPSSTGNVGIGTTTPKSLLDIDGAMGTTFVNNSATSGTVTLDNTAAVWYFTGTGAKVGLPAANTCANRRYLIVNRNANTRTFATGTGMYFTTLTGTTGTSGSPNTMAANSSIELIADGTNNVWLQIQ